jgi:hypothetical protein
VFELVGYWNFRLVCVTSLCTSIDAVISCSPVIDGLAHWPTWQLTTNRVLEQYGGALCERNGPDLDPVEWKSAPNTCFILPAQREQVHLFARVPLIIQGLRNQVQTLFEPRRDDIMAPGVSLSLHSQQCRLFLRRTICLIAALSLY